VREWVDKTGKSWSETVCLLIIAGGGNLRLIRHPVAQPLQHLRFMEETYRKLLSSPTHDPLHDSVRRSLDDLERLLAPPAHL
jgi:hypothetical protein